MSIHTQSVTHLLRFPLPIFRNSVLIRAYADPLHSYVVFVLHYRSSFVNLKVQHCKLIIYTGRLIINIYFENAPFMSYTIHREVIMTKYVTPEIPDVPKQLPIRFPSRKRSSGPPQVVHGEWIRVRIVAADREGLPSDQGFHLLSFHK